MPGVGPVGLRALLLALQRGSLRRLGQVHLGADPVELLDHEPPARRRLQRHLETIVDEPAEKHANRVAIGWRDPGARDLAGDRVDPLGRDLRPVLIQTHHDRHQTTSSTASTLRATGLQAALRAAHRIP
jgi:hypothetical protein